MPATSRRDSKRELPSVGLGKAGRRSSSSEWPPLCIHAASLRSILQHTLSKFHRLL